MGKEDKLMEIMKSWTILLGQGQKYTMWKKNGNGCLMPETKQSKTTAATTTKCRIPETQRATQKQ